MNHDNNTGFTLIELMLSMTFVAMLLVAIAMTTIQVSQIYTKGVTLREVNQAGRSVTSELQRAVSSSVPFDVTPQVDLSPATAKSKYVVYANQGGRLCTGQYSYVWNYGVAMGPSAPNRYSDGSAVDFAKVTDQDGALCANRSSKIDRTKSVELLANGDRDLVLHGFTIDSAVSDLTTGQAIYFISFIIGTNDGNEIITPASTSCEPPSTAGGNQDYCSVNKFQIIATAGNEKGAAL